jgi:transposase InsO family protein
VKYAFITKLRAEYSVTSLCKALQVSRSGYYNWLAREPSKRQQFNRDIVLAMKCIFHDTMQTYGSPRMHVELREKGFDVSLGRIERLMRKNGIQAIQGKRNKRIYQHRQAQPSQPNILNREFGASEPNRKWVSDITFIETRQGWLYLAVIMDLYSRAIVGWSMSDKINGQLVQDALIMASTQRSTEYGLLVHSDQGSQYTASSYRNMLSELGMICSMSRKGECHDNAVAESFFHSLKVELIYNQQFKTRDEARQAIFKYIEIFYNRKRRHSYLNYRSPLEYEKIMNAA